jgi:hypothetical protein
MKTYFENIEWYDYLIFLVYNGVFSYLLYRLADVFLNIGKKAALVFVILFQCYFVLVIGDSFFNYLPYLPDTDIYAFMIGSGQYPQTSSENIIALYYMTLIIAIICLNSPVIFIFFCMFLYIVSLMIFIRAWKVAFPQFNQQGELAAALLMFLLPSAAVYMTAPLREAFIIFGFSLFFNGFVNFIYKQQWKSLIIGSILICAIRLQLLVMVFPVLGALAVYKLNISKMAKGGILAATLLIAGLVVRYVLVEEPLSPETMAALRNRNLLSAGPLGYGNVSWESYLDMAKDYPFIILQFLFSPLPIFVQHNPLQTFIPFLDSMFLIVLLIIIFSKFRKHIRNHAPLLLFVLFYIILFGGYEYHLGGAVRHRMPLMIIFILLAAQTVGNILFKPTPNDNTEHPAVDH